MMSSFCNTPVVSLQFQAHRHQLTTKQRTDIIDHGVPAPRNYMNVRLTLPRNQRNRRFRTDKLTNLYVNRFQYV